MNRFKIIYYGYKKGPKCHSAVLNFNNFRSIQATNYKDHHLKAGLFNVPSPVEFF